MDILAFLCDAERSGSYVEKTLIAAIVSNPEDEIAVKAYGDYLEEHNRTLAAMIVRSEGFRRKVISYLTSEISSSPWEAVGLPLTLASGAISTLRIASGGLLSGPGPLVTGSGSAITHFLFERPSSNSQYEEVPIRSGQIGLGVFPGYLPPNETTSQS